MSRVLIYVSRNGLSFPSPIFSILNSFSSFFCVQKVQPYDKRYQYLLFAAEPYEIIAFKVCFFCLFVSFRFMALISQHILLELCADIDGRVSHLFQVPSTEIDKSTPKFFSHWDPDSKMFTVSASHYKSS